MSKWPDVEALAVLAYAQHRLDVSVVPSEELASDTEDFAGLVADLVELQELEAAEREETLATYGRPSAGRYPTPERSRSS